MVFLVHFLNLIQHRPFGGEVPLPLDQSQVDKENLMRHLSLRQYMGMYVQLRKYITWVVKKYQCKVRDARDVSKACVLFSLQNTAARENLQIQY